MSLLLQRVDGTERAARAVPNCCHFPVIPHVIRTSAANVETVPCSACRIGCERHDGCEDLQLSRSSRRSFFTATRFLHLLSDLMPPPRRPPPRRVNSSWSSPPWAGGVKATEDSGSPRP